MMENILIVLFLLLLTTAIVFYLIRSHKRGKACVGCPYGGKCGGNCGGNSSACRRTHK